MANKLKEKIAFSVIEISITLLIVGILIASISQSSSLYDKYILYVAKKETRNSPVPSNEGLIMWFEATLDDSFDEFAREDYESLSEAEKNTWSKFGKITEWFNIAPNINDLKLTNFNNTTAPIYKSNCINRLPCAFFNGIDSLLQFSELPLAGKNYTIFIVEKSELNSLTAPLISTADISGADDHIFLANYNNSSIFLSTNSADTISYNFSTDSFDKPLLHSISSNYNDYYYYTIPSSGSTLMYQYLYENNDNPDVIPPTKASDGSFLSFYSSYLTSNLLLNNHYLGHGQVRSPSGSISTEYFHGGIGEVIIYDRRLSAQERKRIQKYLIKKWRIKQSPQPDFYGTGGGNEVVS